MSMELDASTLWDRNKNYDHTDSINGVNLSVFPDISPEKHENVSASFQSRASSTTIDQSHWDAIDLTSSSAPERTAENELSAFSASRWNSSTSEHLVLKPPNRQSSLTRRASAGDPPRRELRPSHSLPVQKREDVVTVRSWLSSSPSAQSNEPPRRPPPNRIKSIGSHRRPADVVMSSKELLEENELLRQQVIILQATLQENEDNKEAARAHADLASLEDKFCSTGSSWRKDKTNNSDMSEEKEEAIVVTSDRSTGSNEEADASQPEVASLALKRAIEFSMELAESRAQVDALKSELLHSQQMNERLQQQLLDTINATINAEPLSCPHCGTGSSSYHGALQDKFQRTPSSWTLFGARGGLFVEKLAPKRNGSTDSISTTTTVACSDSSTESMHEEANEVDDEAKEMPPTALNEIDSI